MAPQAAVSQVTDLPPDIRAESPVQPEAVGYA